MQLCGSDNTWDYSKAFSYVSLQLDKMCHLGCSVQMEQIILCLPCIWVN